MRKLKNNKGETIVELLFSILIATLAVSLLFGCIVSSININENAKENDIEFTTNLNGVESRTSVHKADGEVELKKGIEDINSAATFTDVKVYGNTDIFAYSQN